MLVLVTLVQLHILTTHCLDIPQMQVLYYSSDPAVKWPPESGDRVGHKEQLAKHQVHKYFSLEANIFFRIIFSHQPRERLEVAYKKGFPGAGDFYSNFVERRRPVMFTNAVDNQDWDFLRLENLNTSARAALSFTDVSSFTSLDKEQDSLRYRTFNPQNC